MSICSSALAAQAKKCLCDPMWALSLLGEEFDDETLNDSISDTLGGSSYVLDNTRLESTRKAPKKTPQKNDRKSVSEGDKVMEYFLGAGDDSDEEGERAKETFRRRRKKLQQTSSTQAESDTAPNKPRTIWVGNPASPGGKANPNNVTSKEEDKQRTKPKPKQSSPSENIEDGDANSIGSGSALTNPTFLSAMEATVDDHKDLVPRNEGQARSSPQAVKEGRQNEANKKVTTPTATVQQNSRTGKTSPRSISEGYTGKTTINEFVRPSMQNTSKMQTFAPSSVQQQTTEIRDEPGGINTMNSGISNRGWHQRRRTIEDVDDDERIPVVEQTDARHKLYGGLHERELRTINEEFGRDGYYGRNRITGRSVERLSKIPVQETWRGSASRLEGPASRLERAAIRFQTAMDLARNPELKTSSWQGAENAAETMRNPPHKPTPHIISDISRRELELRSFGVYGMTSAPRLGGREQGVSQRRSTVQSRYDAYRRPYALNERPRSRDKNNFVDLTSRDDSLREGMHNAHVSTLPRVEGRYTREHIDKSMGADRYSAQRSVSVPREREELFSEFYGDRGEILTAGSLKL